MKALSISKIEINAFKFSVTYVGNKIQVLLSCLGFPPPLPNPEVKKQSNSKV